MTTPRETVRPESEISTLDRGFAQALGRILGERDPDVLAAAELLSRSLADGHVCLELDRLHEAASRCGIEVSDPAAWRRKLQDSVLTTGEHSPLVIDHERLYLRRYLVHEGRVARAIRERVEACPHDWDPNHARDALDGLFPEADAPVDWQRVAVWAALRRRFTVVSGGPGTGKTTTVARMLAAFSRAARLRGAEPPRVALLAPTARAAKRLDEAIGRVSERLGMATGPTPLRREPASTIHRRLGAPAHGGTRFRHNRNNPLGADVVIVDEASMVPLALMARLIDAVREDARLILLGDRDQLASVEAGNVLGEICNAGLPIRFSPAMAREVKGATGDRIPEELCDPHGPPIRDCIVQLRRNYRFPENSELARLAAAVRDGDVTQTLAILDAARSEVCWLREAPAQDRLALWREGYATYTAAVGRRDWRAALAALERFRVLCALRRGPAGIAGLNREIDAALASSGLLPGGRDGYEGRPILVTVNDYDVGLFNGDTAVVGETDGTSVAHFVTPGASEGTPPRAVPLPRVPDWEPAFAITVHKSQGSEFDRVALVLPEPDTRVLTRELLYTGITRARQHLDLLAARDAVVAAVDRRMERGSGLRDRLWTTHSGANLP